MSKDILVVYYSQTGQLTQILNEFVAPLQVENSVEMVNVKLHEEFAFPWSAFDFFAAMPDTVLGRPYPLAPFILKKKKYDLIIFGYQPWFLSPSIPATSILVNPVLAGVLKDSPVITIIGARNMWLNAQEVVKKKLAEQGADLVGNIAWVDKNNNLASAVSITYWLIYGKKEKLWGIFPQPGIADEDIKNASAFGEHVLPFIRSNDWQNFQNRIVEMGGVAVRTNIMFIEKRAPRLFSIWAKLIDGRKKKRFWINAFKFYLFFALFVVSPILLLLYNILIVPFSQKALKEQKKYFQGLSLK